MSEVAAYDGDAMQYQIPLKLRRFIIVDAPPEDRTPYLPAGEPCWLMPDNKLNNAGYGQIKFNGKTWNTHRLAWHLLVERLPMPGTTKAREDTDILDHLCERRACCNPAHLEKITQSDNVKRGARWR